MWRDIIGYEGIYQVSNKGNVFSIERMVQGRECGGITLKPKHRRDGYLHVGLYRNGKMKNKLIHRLVLEAFVENPNNLPEVNHKDENPSNNELSNLEWCDAGYNSNYGTRTEKIALALSKKVRAVNIENGEVVRFKSIEEAGRKGYASGNVSLACRGLYKTDTGRLMGGDGRTYRGHKWYYEEDVVE